MLYYYFYNIKFPFNIVFDLRLIRQENPVELNGESLSVLHARAGAWTEKKSKKA